MLHFFFVYEPQFFLHLLSQIFKQLFDYLREIDRFQLVLSLAM